jgi:uncharacterized membrane protein
MYIGIYLAIILSILHFTSSVFVRFTRRYSPKLLSLSAGILLAILFLEFFPTFSKQTLETNYLLFLLPLFGFITFHSVRTYNFKHIKTKKEFRARYRKNHMIGFFIEHFILGLALTLMFSKPIVEILLFLPFVLLTISSSILLHIIDKTSKSVKNRLILGSSTLLGAVVGTLFSLDRLLYIGAFGYAMGALLFIVVRDIIPLEEKKGSILYFLVGLIISVAVLLAKGII